MFKTMLVEDNVIFRDSLRDSLRLKFPSMEIAEADNRVEALAKIASFSPNLIFMDIRLPGQNGLALTEMIKKLYPGIIIIILTSYDIPEYREAAARFKADYFFSKDSMTSEEVITLVKSILSEKGLRANGSNGGSNKT
ncbi:MAG TPA: response regulator transcription factor [Thermodesulfobacteriota bacterium]|nr:response regulator transcription factor [Thermodesulfobacteriota bacterium]